MAHIVIVVDNRKGHRSFVCHSPYSMAQPTK